MSVSSIRWLRSAWPLVGVIVVVLIGVALAGPGGGVLAGALAGVVFGAAYLVRNHILRRRGILVAPPPKTPVEKAKSSARVLRAGAIAELAFAPGALALALGNRGQLLPGRVGTAALLIAGAFALTSVPYLWAVAELRAARTTNRKAWAAAGALDLVFGLAALIVAIMNQLTHWVGGGGWTVALSAVAVLWLVGAPAELRRAVS